MKLPTIRKQKNGRRRRGRGISLWNLLTGKWGRQHRLPAHVTGEADWEVEVPQIRMSRAFAVMLVLHVVAVGGLFAFRIWGKDDAEKSAAVVAQPTDAPTTITAPDPAAPEIPAVSQEPVITTKADPVKTYTWHSGDSLPLVAARFGVSSSAFREANPDAALVPGAELIVPRAGRVIGGADSGPVEGQPSAIFDPLANAATPAESRPPKAEVVPELALASEIPDVLPPHDKELVESKARTISTTATAPKKTPVKPKDNSAAVKTKPAAQGTPVTTPAPPARAAGQRVHVVTKNDTVYSLARKYGFTAEEIAKANALDANYNIKLGQQLRVPVKR